MPFVPRNAATIPPGVADAEIFGSAKNFPNAGMPEREGIVGLAQGGTVFFDEIAEMPEDVQAHLLRLMDAEGQYSRVGDPRVRSADVRFVGATNRPLSAVKHDVLARFTVQLELPSLNDRREDIPLLIRHLLQRRVAESPEIAERFAARAADGSVGLRIDPALIVALVRHHYRTNVRELDALLWKSMLASAERDADRLEVPPELEELDDEPHADVGVLLDGLARTAGVDAARHAEAKPKVTLAQLRACLDRNHWHIAKTAEELGMNRHTLGRWIKALKESGEL